MKNKFAQLNEEMQRYNQQYYQFIQQGQQKMIQIVFGGLGQAAEKIAASKGYTMILNKQACFYSAPTLDVTTDMIKEMDKNYDEEAKKQAVSAPVAPAAAVKEETKKSADTKAAAPIATKEEAKKSADTKTAAPIATKEEAKKSAKVEEKKSAEAVQSR
jgi:type IV secretory pathway VirB10-like protein